MSDATELYERDFYAWTQDQAAHLRAWPEGMRPNALDIDHLAEEIEDLGTAQRSAARSLLRQIAVHLLKLRFHPDASAINHWRGEVSEFRIQVEDIFHDSPSLRARRHELAEAAWAQAARIVGRLLADEGHRDACDAMRQATAEAPCFDLDREVLNENWFPDRESGRD
ncbi:MAG: DUF29 domain-containing protein [Acetobacteraceae bacterium]|nr:DUF29 domain-containing protein [Acetobacteraceae bacterium]